MRDRRDLRETLRSGLWFIPGAMVLGSLALVLVLTEIDHLIQRFDSGTQVQVALARSPQAADSILSVIAGSMLSLTVLVFSITVVVLQLAADRFSASTMRHFFRDRSTKIALGLFLGTFVFALAGLRALRYGFAGGPTFVPGLVVFTAFLLVLASMVAFLHYIHHVTRAIRAGSVVSAIAEETLGVIDRVFPDALSAEGSEPCAAEVLAPLGEPVLEVAAPRGGYVADIDEPRLAQVAAQADVVIEVPAIGTFVPQGGSLLRAYGHTSRTLSGLERSIRIRDERELEHDVAFGLHELADIGLHALSASVLDATVAENVLDRLYEVLRVLGKRAMVDRLGTGSDGHLRVVVPCGRWEHYVTVALRDIASRVHELPSAAERFERLVTRLTEELPLQRADVVRRVAESRMQAVVGR